MASPKDIRAGKAHVEIGVLDRVSKGLDQIQKRLKNFAAGAAKIGAGTAAAGSAVLGPLLAASTAFASRGDAFSKFADKTGVAVEAASELAYAAGQSAVEIATLEKGMKGMAKTLADAASGSAGATAKLEALGLTWADLESLSPDKRFELLADRIARIEDPSLRAAAAMDVFGGAGQELLPMFAAGAAGIDELRHRARELGQQVSSSDAAAATKLGDTWADVGKIWDAVVFKAGAALAPTLTTILEDIIDLTAWTTRWIDENRQLIIWIAAAGAALVAAGFVISGVAAGAMGLSLAIGGVSAVAGMAATVLGALLSPVGLLTVGLVAGAAAWLAYTDSGQAALGGMLDLFGDLKSIGLDAFAGITAALKSGDWAAAGEIAMAGLEAAWLAGIAKLTGVWEDFKVALIETFAGVVIAVQAMWSGMQNRISNQLLEWAAQDTLVGAVVRKGLGSWFDPTAERGRQEAMISGTRYALETNRAEQARYAGDPAKLAELMEAEQRLLARLASLGQGDPVADATRQAKGIIDAATAASQEATGRYWGGLARTARETADERTAQAEAAADAARRRLAELSSDAQIAAQTKGYADDFAAAMAEGIQDTTDQTAGYAADFAAAMEAGPAPTAEEIAETSRLLDGVDADLSQTAAAVNIGTASSYAVESLLGGFANRAADETAKNTRDTVRQLETLTRTVRESPGLAFG